jgi:undecaprenyl-diphosphatase
MDDRLFLNTATFGVYADVVRLRERWRPLLRKWGAASAALLTAFFRMNQVEVGLEVDGRFLWRRTPLVWVGVGWGSCPFVHEAPERRASPDLEIVIVRPRGRLGTLAFLLRLGVGLRERNQPVEDPALEVLHTRALLIRSVEKIGVTLDGEVTRTRGPIFVAIVDEALPVVAPCLDSPPAATASLSRHCNPTLSGIRNRHHGNSLDDVPVGWGREAGGNGPLDRRVGSHIIQGCAFALSWLGTVQ